MTRYVQLSLLCGALMLPMGVAKAADRDDHHERDRREEVHRYDDRAGHDQHEWNEREDRAYRQYLKERRKEYRDFNKASRREQQDYWKWRHSHRDDDDRR